MKTKHEIFNELTGNNFGLSINKSFYITTENYFIRISDHLPNTSNIINNENEKDLMVFIFEQDSNVSERELLDFETQMEKEFKNSTIIVYKLEDENDEMLYIKSQL
jgi:hypothetical protein